MVNGPARLTDSMVARVIIVQEQTALFSIVHLLARQNDRDHRTAPAGPMN